MCNLANLNLMTASSTINDIKYILKELCVIDICYISRKLHTKLSRSCLEN